MVVSWQACACKPENLGLVVSVGQWQFLSMVAECGERGRPAELGVSVAPAESGISRSCGQEEVTTVSLRQTLPRHHCDPHPRTHKMLLTSIVTASCLLASSVQALYFYIDGTTPKCFYEELPKDTLVVGQ